MKRKAGIVFIFLLLGTVLSAQPGRNLLQMTGETLVFAFQTKAGKWAYVCREKNDAYLVCRFGTPKKVELQYPAVPDTSSWQLFGFKGYERGGGIENAAMQFAYLTFINNDIAYEIYETWNAEDNMSHCGVSVVKDGKTIDIKGKLKSRKGYLLALQRDAPIRQEE